MVANRRTERRAHARKKVAVTGQLVCHTDDQKVTLTTRNLSCSGLYCMVSNYLPPFTRVNVAMALPVHDGQGRSHNKLLAFEGVVVRTEPEQETPGCDDYHVAVFFSGITPEARELIRRYIVEHGEGDPGEN